MILLRKFFSYYLPYKNLFIIDFSCAILSALLELIFPLAISNVLDNQLPKGDWNIILYSCLGLLAIYTFSAFLNYVVTYWGHKLGISIEADMRKQLFEKIQKLSFNFFDNNKTGHLLSRMTNELMDIGEIAHHGPEDIFIAIMTLLGAFGIMVHTNWKLALLTFLIIPIMSYLSIFFNRKMAKAFEQMFKDIGNYNSGVENNILGMKVVQAFSNENYEIEKFSEHNHQFFLTKCVAYGIMAWNSAISFILTKLVHIFVLVCGTWFVINGEMSNGDFVAFVMLSNVFLGPIKQISATIESYPKGIASFKRYIELLETEPDVKEMPGAKEIEIAYGNITYDNVTFTYEGKEGKVLENISLKINQGETVALVGPSGTGKSTLTSLLPRFYDINDGKITIDGIDIKEMKLDSLRGGIGIVQQDVFLFDGTIRENVAYGKLGASEDEIWLALKQAQLDEYVSSLPDGLDTLVGERGAKLSGGQKQRISIARMFLKNPRILILDEATSSLDTQTEAAIQKALVDLSKGRTTIIIAHRLSTIKNADKIVVLEGSGIAELGTHEELINNHGVYKSLYEAQSA